MGPQIGDPVVYVDEVAVEHAALVTANWGDPANDTPSLNVVYVDGDATKTDSYGRQIVRQTSTVHSSNQSAHGRYWRLP